MMSNENLIFDLASNVAPVKRRSIGRDALMLLALAALELALLLMSGLMRPDFGQVITEPFMIWKVGSLALLAGASCAVALGSFSPPSHTRRNMRLVLVGTGLAVLSGAFVGSGSEVGQSLLERLSPARGIVCTAAIVMLSLPLMAMLAVLMRRAAPVRPRSSALAAGTAAATVGALLFTVCCPVNDPLYIVVWYSAAVAIVTAASRMLLPRRFRL